MALQPPPRLTVNQRNKLLNLYANASLPVERDEDLPENLTDKQISDVLSQYEAETLGRGQDHHDFSSAALNSMPSAPFYSESAAGYPPPAANYYGGVTAPVTFQQPYASLPNELMTSLNSMSMVLPSTSEVDYAILVIGITGSGKSSACNFYLNQKVFDTRGGAVSVTTKSDAHTGVVLGKNVLFIDTPGFSDAYESEEQRMADLGKALLYAKEGVHAVVICFNGNARFDEASENVVRALSDLGSFWPHAFVLYTHADDMGDDDVQQRQEVSRWLSSPRCPERLKWILEQVKHRFITVESKVRHGDTQYHQQKCLQLFQMVDTVFRHNRQQLYTNGLFKWAKEMYDQVKQEKRKQEKELKQCQQSVSDYEEILRSVHQENDNQKAKYEKEIQELKDRVMALQTQQSFSPTNSGMEDQIARAQREEQASIQLLTSCVAQQQEMIQELRASHQQQLRDKDELMRLQQKTVAEECMQRMQKEMREMNREHQQALQKSMLESNDRQMQKSKRDGSPDLVQVASDAGKLAVKYASGFVTKQCSIM